MPSTLAERLCRAPHINDQARADRELAALRIRVADDDALRLLGAELQATTVTDLLAGIFSCSPYLVRLINRYPEQLQRCLSSDPDTLPGRLRAELDAAVSADPARASVMRLLRRYKSHIALLTALADLGGVWPLSTVTRVLSEAADTAVALSVRVLFQDAQSRGDWIDREATAEARSGYFILAMGKHGAFELNYSSDIDLIVFYDARAAKLAPSLELQTFYVRLTRDLVKFLQEATEDGYVFRTDLRLRPDPGSTAIALSTDAALNYYESVGQNWERAAMIKARVIAGDFQAGAAFLGNLSPYIWRKYLDFAAISDIHAMKRQIHATKGFGVVAVEGHDIKVGRGGIREIEFFAQTQQLIAGGRQRDLRVRDTVSALDALVTRQWIASNVRDDLAEAYEFLRTVEHRLQMLNDEQTQRLPRDSAQLETLAAFAGFSHRREFAYALTRRLGLVQTHYSQLFEASPSLTAKGRDMVFAGASDDPATIAALSGLGYSHPSTIIECVRGWHHGRIRAIRSPRARELLTEVQPRLIEALAATANPDQAFASFDRFLSDLPSGVQLFSLLKQHPALLDLVAAVMGTAPKLAQTLSRRGRVLDAVLDPGFFGALSATKAADAIIGADFDGLSFEAMLDRARVIGSEQAFLIGVRILTGTISAANAGHAYAALADQLLQALTLRVEREMSVAHGTVPGGAVAVVAMGKLGGREMTAASDLDLIVIYDFDDTVQQSDGARPLAPVQYYTRLTQRLIGAFSVPTAEGQLYEIDLRLRPSGQKGPVATQLSSFVHYQAHDAWTWEHMALTRARVITGPPALRAKIEAAIARTLCVKRDRAKIAADVRDMRRRIANVKSTSDTWDLKQMRGGMVDLEFIVQHLQLIHAADDPSVLDQATLVALGKLVAQGRIAVNAGAQLLAAGRLYNDLTQVLRLSLDGEFKAGSAPDGLKRLLARVADLPSFDRLEPQIRAMQRTVADLFDELVV